MNKKTLAFLLIIASQQSLAEQWYIEPEVKLKTEYDDNVRLSPINEEDDYSTLFTGDVYFGTRTEISDIKVHAQLNSIKFARLKDFDFTGGKLGLETEFTNDLDQFALKASYDRDSTRNTELTETGNIFQSIERTRLNISPSWQRQYSERATVFANYGYSDINFEKTRNLNFNDYWYDNANLGVSYLFTEKTTIQTSIGLARYETESISSSKYDQTNIRMDFTHQISESSTGGLTLGYMKTDSEFNIPGLGKTSISDNNWQFDANYKKQFEITSFNAELSVSEIPSSQGRLLRKKALNLGFKRQLNERLNLSVNVEAYKNETGGGISLATDSREFLSIQPRLTWKATEWWIINCDYRYIHSENPDRNNGAAEANRISVTARYIWPRENN